MSATHTYPYGSHGMNHSDAATRETDWIESEKRHLQIAQGIITIAFAAGMLIGAYYLLW